MAAKPIYAVGLDAGSRRTRCLICAVENRRLRLLGFGEAPARGWMKGNVAAQSAIAESISRAVREAERRAEVSVESVVLGIGGPGVASAISRGGYEFGYPREIEQRDIDRVIERASRVQLPEDRMLLHLYPQDFVVEGHPGHRSPLGIVGSRLEVYVHIVTCSKLEHDCLIGAANQVSVGVDETMFEPLAAAYSAVLAEDREEGVALVDIGAHSAGLVIYRGEALVLATSLPISGDHFTRDVARGLTVIFEEAERIKEQHGCALLGLTADNSIIEVPSPLGRPPRETPRRHLNLILEARAEEFFQYVRRELLRVGMDQELMNGVVLTGGGALLNGMCDMAERVLNCQARNGLVIGIDDWPDEIDNPEWTAVAGLAMFHAGVRFRVDLDRKSTSILSGIFG